MSMRPEDSRQSACYEELLAKQAITEQIYLYCRAMDRIDRELGCSIWHPHGTAEYGRIFSGSGADFVHSACKYHEGLLGHSHQVTNIVIVIAADKATSEAYVTVALRQELGGKVFEHLVRGRYLDRWSKRAGRWAIDKRVYLHDFDDLREIGEQRHRCGSYRDRRDLIYTLSPS